MTARRLVVTLSILLVSVLQVSVHRAQALAIWNPAPSLNTARASLAEASAPCPTGSDTCIYAIGGTNGSGNLQSVEYLDPNGTAGWTTSSARLTMPRENLAATSGPCPTGTDTCIYAIGGTNGNGDLSSVEYYDPRSGGWTTLFASLTTPREGLAAVSAPCPSGNDTCIYAIGGLDGSTYLQSVEYYDPLSGASAWSTLTASLNTARASLGATTTLCPSGGDTCIYAVGGSNSSGSYLQSAEYFDPKGTAGWTALSASLNTARAGLGVTSIPCPTGSDSCLYADGGVNSSGDLQSVEYYDPRSSTSTWTTVSATMNTPRGDLAIAGGPCPGETDTCIYAFGGINNGAYLQSAEYYDPRNVNYWVPLSTTLNTSRQALAATTAPCPTGSDTCIYAIGGYNNNASLNSVEYYDPKGTSGGTALAATLNTPRQALAATAAPCPNGSDTCIYAIGGYGSSSSTQYSVEYNDPAGASGWTTLSASLNINGVYSAATSAPCPNGNDTCIYDISGNSAQYYDPRSGGNWITLSANLNASRYYSSAVSAPCPTGPDTCIYAIGGSTSGALQSAEYYAPQAGGNWTMLSSNLNTGRYDLAATSAPCPGALETICIYAIGGYNSNGYGYLQSVEYYDPASGGSWTTLAASLNTPRYLLAGASAPCELTADTCIYAIGGTSGNQYLNSAEYYDTGGVPLQITAGWNLLDLPFQLRPHSASGLVANLDNSLGAGAVTEVATYQNGRFDIYLPGFSPDQLLYETQGIFVNSTAPGVWTLPGTIWPNSGNQIALQPGWNLVAVPFLTSGISVNTILNDLGASNVAEIVAYNGPTPSTYPGSLTTIRPTQGFWIEMNTSETWTTF